MFLCPIFYVDQSRRRCMAAALICVENDYKIKEKINMAVFRVERNQNYTVMSNYHLRDKSLSLKAKGLLSQMLSLPEDWDYTLTGLARINCEGRDAIRAAVKELEEAGYVTRSRIRNEKGHLLGTEYVIREQPFFSAEPALEEPASGNPTLGETTELNKDTKQNKDLQSKDSIPFPSAPPVVGTSSASLASPQAAKLTRCAVPPLPTQPASLGLRGDPFGLAARSCGTLF